MASNAEGAALPAVEHAAGACPTQLQHAKSAAPAVPQCLTQTPES